jgi:hypothetical protein
MGWGGAAYLNARAEWGWLVYQHPTNMSSAASAAVHNLSSTTPSVACNVCLTALCLLAMFCIASAIVPAIKPSDTNEPQKVAATNIIICIDTSASMASTIENAIKNFNTEILDSQKRLFSNAVDIAGAVSPEDLALMTLIRFSGREDIRVVFQDVRIQDVSYLLPGEWRASGMTALRDAIILADGLQLKSSNRKTLVFYITDGGDTDSSRQSLAEVRKIFKKYDDSQQNNMANATIAYFLGSNQDAVQNGAGMGLHSATTLSYADSQVKFGMKSVASIIMASVAERSFEILAPVTREMRWRSMHGKESDEV